MSSTPDVEGAVQAAVEAHHDTLQGELVRRANVLFDVVATHGAHEPAQQDLVDFLRGEVLPQAEAEERIFCEMAPDLQTTLLARAMAVQQRQLAALVGEVEHARTGMDAALAASALVALFVMRAEEENTVLLPALAASGIDLADLLGGQPQILGEPADAVASEAATASGHSNTLDMGALDYDQCRRQLRTALQELKPGMTLTVDHGHELLSLRYEIEATNPRAYHWSLPTAHQDDPTRFTTVVESI